MVNFLVILILGLGLTTQVQAQDYTAFQKADKLLKIWQKSSDFLANVNSASMLIRETPDADVKKVLSRLLELADHPQGRCSEKWVTKLIEIKTDVDLGSTFTRGLPSVLPRPLTRLTMLFDEGFRRNLKICLDYIYQVYHLHWYDFNVNGVNPSFQEIVSKGEADTRYNNGVVKKLLALLRFEARGGRAMDSIDGWAKFFEASSNAKAIYIFKPHFIPRSSDYKVTEQRITTLYGEFVTKPCETQFSVEESRIFSLAYRLLKDFDTQMFTTEATKEFDMRNLCLRLIEFRLCNRLKDPPAEIITEITRKFNSYDKKTVDSLVKAVKQRKRQVSIGKSLLQEMLDP